MAPLRLAVIVILQGKTKEVTKVGSLTLNALPACKRVFLRMRPCLYVCQVDSEVYATTKLPR